MARFVKDGAVRQLQTLFCAGALGGLTDRELLEQFVAGSEAETAFEVLVERHGPLVRAACRSLLGDLHEADDAFQATFLVLARRAGSIRNKDAVASWLYGVASRIALRARAEAKRRRSLSRYLTERARREETTKPEAPREEIPELFEEVARLPERYRAPIVLCYLECQTHEQAARTLRCPVTTLQTRLLRAKAKLRTKLARRGLAPSIGLLVFGTAASEASAAVAETLPAALAGSTARSAARYAAVSSAEIKTTILTMAQHALRALLWNRLKVAAGLSAGLAAGLALTVIALFAANKKPDEAVKAITGRVIDARGGPIAGARVWLQGGFDGPERSTAQATTDAQGHYTLVVPEIWAKTPQHERGHTVWAHAAGHQISTASAYQALAGKAGPVDVTLGPATDTSFVVVGPDGRPVAGAVVEPFNFKTRRMYEIPPHSMLPVVRGITDATGRAQLPALPREGLSTVQVTSEVLGIQRLRITDAATEPAQRTIRLRLVGSLDGRIVSDRPEWGSGVALYVTTEIERVAWGQEATTGGAKVVTQADGSFTIPAVATGKLTFGDRIDQALPVRPRLPETLEVRTGQTTHAEIPLEKAVRVSGVIRVKDTGEPVAGAAIAVGYGAPRQNDRVVSDAKGQYGTYVLAGDVTTQVIAMPGPFVQLGQPWNERHHLPSGATTFDLPAIEVVKGVEIRGRLVDMADRPIANRRVVGGTEQRGYAFATSDQNGEFTTNSVPPGIKLSYSVWVNDHEQPVDATILKEEPLLLRVPIDQEKKGRE
jgi:RNA polymerase sigma factor (sigma-70 family)